MSAPRRRFLLVCIGLILVPAPAIPECVDYGNHLYRVGNCDTPGHALAVAVAETWAYVADADGGLQLVDITNPQMPSVVSGLSTPGAACGLAVHERNVHLADGPSGLQIIDVTVFWNPRIIGAVLLPGAACGVAIRDDLTFVACGPSGLAIVDTGDPRNPILLGSVGTPGEAMHVAVSGDHAYVSAGVSGLQVIDVTDPRNPVRVGSLPLPGTAMDVAVSGGYAFVASDSAGVHAVDVRSPAAPVLTGTADTPGRAVSVSVDGVRAYVADDSSGVVVLDLQDPGHPDMLGYLVLPDAARGICVADGNAFLACGAGGMTVVDAANPFSPPDPDVLGSVIIPWATGPLIVQQDRVYMDNGIFYIIDVADPWEPFVVGGLWTPDWTRGGLAVSGDYAYHTQQIGEYPGYGFLNVIEMTDPSHPRIGATLPLADRAGQLAVSGQYGYVLTSSGLLVIDISSPLLPEVVGCESSVFGNRLAIAGNHAYVAGVDFVVVDIGDPANPRRVGSRPNQGGEWIAASGGSAYVKWGEYLLVFDVTNPSDPQQAGVARVGPGYVCDMVLAGSSIYFAFAEDDIRMIDVSDPGAPRIAGTIPMFARGVGIAADIYVANQFGLSILPPQCGAAAVEGTEIPAHPRDLQAFPNPFADRIVVDLGSGFTGTVLAEIYDVAGCRIRSLRDEASDGMRRGLAWDGRDDGGRPVRSGVYLIRVSSRKGDATTRAVLMR